jgi:hypothetical protein
MISSKLEKYSFGPSDQFFKYLSGRKNDLYAVVPVWENRNIQKLIVFDANACCFYSISKYSNMDGILLIDCYGFNQKKDTLNDFIIGDYNLIKLSDIGLISNQSSSKFYNLIFSDKI